MFTAMLRPNVLKQIQTRFLSLGNPIQNKHKYYIDLEANGPKPEGWDQAKPFESIPGPKPLPIVGNALSFLWGDMSINKNLLEGYANVRRKYGDIVAFRKMGSLSDMIMIFSTKEIEKVYRNEGVWPIREGMNTLNIYRKEIRNDIFGEIGSLLNTHGEEWYKVRSTVNPILLQPRTAEQYVSSMNEVADDFITRVEYLYSLSHEMPADFEYELNKWAFESIGVVALDRRFGCLDVNPNVEAQKMAKYMIEIFKMMLILDFSPLGKYIIKYNLPMWKRFVKYQDYFTNMTLMFIEEAIAKIKATPDYQNKPENEKSAFEKMLIKDKRIAMVMTLDMLSAGVDTTGKTTGAALYFLAKNPEIQKKLRKELLEYLPKPDTPINKEILSNLHYLKATIRETTRLSPIGTGNMRMSTQDLVIMGYQVPPGINLIFPNLHLSLSEENFKDPKAFLPDRWLRTTNDEYSHKNVNPFVAMPFGFGRRSCIGKRLANLEMEIAIAKIVRNYELSWPHPDMVFGQDLLYGIKGPLKLHLKKINSL